MRLDDSSIRFDTATVEFRDSAGEPISRADIAALAKATNLGDRGVAGGRTLARSAVLRAVLRETGREGAAGRGRNRVLARLAELGSDSPADVKALFSQRQSAASAGSRFSRDVALDNTKAKEAAQRAAFPRTAQPLVDAKGGVFDFNRLGAHSKTACAQWLTAPVRSGLVR